MKVTLISPYVAVSAIGIRWLSSYLKSQGHSTQLIFLPDPARGLYSARILDDLADLCRDSQLVGISLTSNLVRQSIQLTNKIKDSLPHVLVVWGGVHPSLRPEESLKYADVICIGEGELPLAELMDKMEKGEEYLTTQSLWFRQGDTIIRNKIRRPVEDLDSLGFPDYDFDCHYIKDKDEIVPMTIPLLLQNIPNTLHLPPDTYVTIATRGCPHNCAYCSIPTLRRITSSSKPHRRRSKDHVLRELRSMRERYPFFGWVKFMDDNFLSGPTNYLVELLKSYKKEITLPLHISGVDPASLNEAKMKALADAGLGQIKMGIQTGSEKTKAIYNRRFSNDRVLKATRLIHKYSHKLKIPPYYDLILDNPWETEDDLLETLNLLLEIPRPYKLNIFSLTFFTGTEVTERALREGLIVREDDDWKRVKKTYLNSVLYLFNVPHFPKFILRLLMNNSIRRAKLFAWLPWVVFPAFRLKNLIGWVRRDLKYGEFSRFKKFLWKRLPRGLPLKEESHG